MNIAKAQLRGRHGASATSAKAWRLAMLACTVATMSVQSQHKLAGLCRDGAGASATAQPSDGDVQLALGSHCVDT